MYAARALTITTTISSGSEYGNSVLGVHIAKHDIIDLDMQRLIHPIANFQCASDSVGCVLLWQCVGTESKQRNAVARGELGLRRIKGW